MRNRDDGEDQDERERGVCDPFRVFRLSGPWIAGLDVARRGSCSTAMSFADERVHRELCARSQTLRWTLEGGTYVEYAATSQYLLPSLASLPFTVPVVCHPAHSITPSPPGHSSSRSAPFRMADLPRRLFRSTRLGAFLSGRHFGVYSRTV